MKFTPTQAANLFNVPLDRIKEQYKANAEILAGMHKKAIATGKKVNGYTADQLSKMVVDFQNRAK